MLLHVPEVLTLDLASVFADESRAMSCPWAMECIGARAAFELPCWISSGTWVSARDAPPKLLYVVSKFVVSACTSLSSLSAFASDN